ncbi:hypothetical protein KIH74_11705 [Kineosporia sp. J2-2]|uniref:Uncharacterized protein n=1 Tax=Kineosporia corallincola TaxID=2835133 RepID=A0ABS5TEU0_9ACTN|nr:hypothetical protein [Kineosporia corallincola]MBT0769591.1 hypothetical protein [Kineosporia corallincola]
MLTGTMIMQSLRTGATLDAAGLVFTRLERIGNGWVLGYFTSATIDPGDLAGRFAEVLDAPGWYADLHDDEHHWVIYPGRVFRYRRDDPHGRVPAVAHGLAVGVPAEQLDWED